jgi:hypothetical protein
VTSCDRFETEALLRLEQGLPLDEHFATCPDCLEARASYDRLRKGLGALGERHEPPARWQERVWEALEERRARRSRRWWLWSVVPAGVAAALAAFLLVRTPGEPLSVSLQLEVREGEGAVRRGLEAQPGDQLLLRATAGGAQHAELRVYRNDSDLILRCSDEPPCSRRGDSLEAMLDLQTVGRYQGLLFTSTAPIPPPVSDLDGDAGAALAAGAEIEIGPDVVVR